MFSMLLLPLAAACNSRYVDGWTFPCRFRSVSLRAKGKGKKKQQQQHNCKYGGKKNGLVQNRGIGPCHTSSTPPPAPLSISLTTDTSFFRSSVLPEKSNEAAPPSFQSISRAQLLPLSSSRELDCRETRGREEGGQLLVDIYSRVRILTIHPFIIP